MEEKQLIKLVKDPETRNEGFKHLLATYQEKIYWAIRKIVLDHDDANDVTQDVFLKVYSSISNFRADSQLYTWVYRIAVNESLSFIKKRKRFTTDDTELAQESLKASTYLDGNEVQLKLQKALLQLPEKQRLVFNMKYFDDLKYEDMSKITDTSVGALKASYHHAVKKIESILNVV